MSAGGRGRDWLTAHLPHRGAMNLLDEVVAWDGERLHARARNHGAADHPLRRGGCLPVACAIEYAAQAAAAHGALVDTASPVPGAGFLASVRGAEFHAARLDDVAGPLDVEVERTGEGAGSVAYAFRVRGEGRTLAEGRVTIVLDASVASAMPAA
ncbi:MAG TPA: 3-hydroxylacyl-ACP dehydratase [Usitatibacter sp.]|nr:3-hydroxylacyl-ACP dehydratase [Usitatibacter sp.]